MNTSLIGRRYLVREVIGMGGMGEVLRVHDRLTGKDIALKRVLPTLPILDFDTVPDNAEMLNLALAREFQTLASLRHPNIISVLDYGFEGGKASWFTMELLEAPQTILSYGREQPLSVKIELISQVLQALIYLHRHGVLHRDLKPGNLLVCDGQIKVVDFGLAAHYEREDYHIPAGTLRYLPPEVVNGEVATVQSDLYSLGIIFHELLTDNVGIDLQGIQNVQQLMENISQIVPDFDTPVIPRSLKPILERLHRKDPGERYTSAAETLHTLRHSTGQEVAPETPLIRESFIQAAPFIGRENELAILQSTVQQVASGEGDVWWIGGESGVGKTRLVNEVRIRALVSGLAVATGETRDTGNAPYDTWREVIRRLVFNVELPLEELSALSEIVPELGELLGYELPSLPDLEPRMARSRLFSAVATLLRQHAQPLLIILDDLHWADSGTLDLLHWLEANISPLPVLIVALWRDDERPHLNEQGEHVLHLKRLTQPEIVALSSAILGRQDTTPEVVNFLVRETEGNTFFLVEFIRAMAENAGTLDQIRHTALPATVSTANVQQIIQRRLNRAPASARPLLEMAAVAGRVLDLDVLRAAGITNLEVNLNTCTEASILEIRDTRWGFSHDKLREGMLAVLPETTRATLHERVADAIQKVHADVLESWYLELAYHYQISGNAESERHFTVLAGKQAAELASRGNRRVSDSDDIKVIDAREITQQAINLLTRALELTLPDDLAAIYDLLFARQTVYELVGSREAQRGDLDRLHTLSVQLGDERREAEVAARNCTFYEITGELANAADAGKRALALCQRANDPGLEAWASYRLGRVVRTMGNMQEATDLYKRGIGISQQFNLRYLECQCLRALAFLTNEIRHEQEALPYALESLAIARENKDRVSESWALIVVGESELGLNQHEQGEQHLLEAHRICRETGDKWGQGWATRLIGHCAMQRYDWPASRAWFEQGVELTTSIGDMSNLVAIWLHLGILYLLTGALEDSRSIYQRVVAFSLQSGHKLLATYGYLGESLVLWVEGKPREAIERGQECITFAEQLGSDTLVGNALVTIGQSWLNLGDIQAAHDAFSRAALLLKKGEHPIAGLDADAGLIRVALARGEIQSALEYVENILRIFARNDKRKLIVELGDLCELYLLSYKTLRAAGDARATQVFAESRQYLMSIIAHLSDAAARTRLLNGWPARRELWALCGLDLHQMETVNGIAALNVSNSAAQQR